VLLCLGHLILVWVKSWFLYCVIKVWFLFCARRKTKKERDHIGFWYVRIKISSTPCCLLFSLRQKIRWECCWTVRFKLLTCLDLLFLELVIHIILLQFWITQKRKKREKGKGKEVLKAASKKKEGKEEKFQNCMASFESLVESYHLCLLELGLKRV